jgi:hypothetical protein
VIVRAMRRELVCFLRRKDVGVVLKDCRELESQLISFLLHGFVDVFECNYADLVASFRVGSYRIHANRSNVSVVQVWNVAFRHFSESFLSGRLSCLVAVLNAVGIIEFLGAIGLVRLWVVLLKPGVS